MHFRDADMRTCAQRSGPRFVKAVLEAAAVAKHSVALIRVHSRVIAQDGNHDVDP